MDDVEKWAKLWIAGILIVVIMLIATTFFGFFGLTLSFAILGQAVDSVKSLIFVLIAFGVLPLTFGWVALKVIDILNLD